MKIRFLGLMLGATSLAVWGTACEQPQIDCRATRGSFAATFVLQNGSGACAELTSGVVGLESYYEKAADGKIDITKSSLAIGVPDFGAIQGDVHGLIDEGCAEDTVITSEQTIAEGDFASPDPADGICSVANPSAASFTSTAIPASGDPMDPMNPCAAGLPAQTVTYEWRNLEVFVTTDGPGNCFQADLTFTENDCSATYKVCGIWPLIHCEKLKLDSDTDPACEELFLAPDTCKCPGHPVGEPCAVLDLDANGNPQPEQKLCDGEPDLEPQYAIPFGSGINTDYQPVCDPVSLICVLPKCPIQ